MTNRSSDAIKALETDLQAIVQASEAVSKLKALVGTASNRALRPEETKEGFSAIDTINDAISTLA